MKTSFTLTPEDFSRFQRLVARRFKRKLSLLSALFFARVACWVFVGMAGASFFQLLERHPQLSGSLRLLGAFLVLAIVAMLAAAPLQQALVRRHMLLPNGAFLSPQAIALSESALLIDTTRGRSELRWQGFLDAEQDDKNYYLLVDAMQAVIIPKASVETFRSEFEAHLSRIDQAS